MQLLNPRLPRELNRRIQEDDLVLYPNLVNDGVERQVAFQGLKMCRN